MKKSVLIALILAVGLLLWGCSSVEPKKPVPEEDKMMAEVTKLVENFGMRLQAVSLQAPRDILAKSMQENYGEYVAPELLTQWLQDPLHAPGRLTSSPWPDGIEIINVKKTAENAYQIEGKIIEISSTEKEQGGVTATRPITLTAEKTGENWQIKTVTLGEYEKTQGLEYKNTQYGFTFALPQSWQGYSIVSNKWEGRALGGTQENKVVEKGDLLSIRHPQWTDEKPRQDIPIMVFTLEQWKLVQEEKLSVGAAPIRPKELARNAKYVFALPARYNYAFPTGYEEVEKILEGNPLQAN